jgi:2-aminoethylphosphonate-pyruvate transaminase
MQAVKTAVILAAGMGTRLGEHGRFQPKGLLRLGEKSIIEESVARLQRAAIERIIIVTGHCREWYDEFARASGGSVGTIFNEHYADSGSMYSLYCARHDIDDDFLLLESDLIYEQRALDSALSFPKDNCVLLSGFTESNDEVFVQCERDRLVNMSKNLRRLSGVSGELVGITRISTTLFSIMLEIAETVFETSRHYDYETDCLVEAGKRHPVYCCLVSDLVWAEIDDAAHLERARSIVYPEIVKRDSDMP